MNDPTMEGTTPENPGTTDGSRSQFRPLRAWPAFLLAFLMLVARFGPGLSEEGSAKYWMVAVFGPLLGCLLLLIWWLAASRATWRERLFGFLGLIASAAITITLAHPTMRGAATTYFTLPMGFFLFALTAALLKKSPPAIRSGTAVLLAFAGFSVSMLLRSDGMTGDYKFSFHSRWKQTAEDVMLAAQRSATPKPTAQIDRSSLTNSLAHPEWPEFRGSDRAGRSLAPGISTNWNDHPPKQLWKIPVGPGWSSFAVAGRMLFTQDQRGPKETVVCYDADSGREIWKTEIDGRLDDPMGGPGPRATPTLANGALYVVASTGAFLRLDPVTGKIVWRKELPQVADSKVPMWGFSASPLVTESLVVVYAGGPGNKGLLAFDTASGELRWSVATGSESYGSPQLNTIQGEALVLMFSNDALLLVDPASGLQSGSNLIVHWDDSNLGTGAIKGSWYDYVTIKNITTGEVLDTVAVAYAESGAGNGSILAGGLRARQFSYTLPDGLRGTGQIQITVAADAFNQIFEFNTGGTSTAESNNTATVTVASLLAPAPDLQVSNLQLTPSAGLKSGDGAVLSWDVQNTGNASAVGLSYSHVVVFNVTTNQIIASGDVVYDPAVVGNGSIAAGGTKSQQFAFTLPRGSPGAGQLKFTVTTDFYSQIGELNTAGVNGSSTAETNNAASMTASGRAPRHLAPAATARSSIAAASTFA